MSFQGFDPSAVEQLGNLPSWSAADYAAAKTRLKAGLLEPGAALIAEIADSLDRDLTVVPRSSVSPLHRDLRFAPDGASRYKDHLLLTTWEGAEKKSSPILWIRIDSECVGFASGEALARAVAKLRSSHKGKKIDLAGQSLQRVPTPWDADHPRANLLRMNAFQIRFRENLPASLGKPAFGRWCTTRLRQLLPVHDWLVEELTSG